MVAVSDNEKKELPIKQFRDTKEYKAGFLSNMYACPVEYNGHVFQSAEAAFQAQKFASRDDGTLESFETMTGAEAKRAGSKRGIPMTPTEQFLWESGRDVETMRGVLKAKFEQNPDLMQQLKETGSRELVEGPTANNVDTKWGVDKFGRGTNYLGKLLMELRDGTEAEVQTAKAVETPMASETVPMGEAKVESEFKPKSACFTGSRPSRGQGVLLGYGDYKGWNNVRSAMTKQVEELAEQGVTEFRSGLAQGVDMEAFYAVEEAKKKYPDIKNIVCMPMKNQGNRWSEKGRFSKETMKDILAKADSVENVWEQGRRYSLCTNGYPQFDGKDTSGKQLNLRNEWMVDNSDVVLAYPNRSALTMDRYSGTTNCIRYAIQNCAEVKPMMLENAAGDFHKYDADILSDKMSELRMSNTDVFKAAASFDTPTAVLVTTNGVVRSDGQAVMGAGIALDAKNIGAQNGLDVAQTLGDYLRSGKGNSPTNLGTVRFEGKNICMISLPTKEHWKDKSEPELVVNSMYGAMKIAEQVGAKNVVVPPAGCGLGGLNWTDVKSSLDGVIKDNNAAGINYVYSSDINLPSRTVEQRKELAAQTGPEKPVKQEPQKVPFEERLQDIKEEKRRRAIDAKMDALLKKIKAENAQKQAGDGDYGD